MSCSVFLITLAIVACVEATDDKSLRYVHVIIGNKFYVPDYNASDSNFRFPKEFSYRYFLENGLELPNRVKKDLYNLGKDLRGLYDLFLGDYYTPDLMKLQTTAYPASQMAGQLVSAGLWPPVGEQDWSNGTLNWQPISFDYEPVEEDTTLLGTLCPNFEKDTKTVASTYNLTISDTLKKSLKNESSINVNDPFQMTLLKVALENSLELHQTPPSWVEVEGTRETLKNLSVVAYDLLSKTPLQRKLNGGGLLKTIVQDIEQLGALEYNSGRISIFSGDDRNLIGVLKNLNKNYFKDLNSELFAGSALIIETYLRNSSKLVKISHRNKYHENSPITLSGCNNMFCSLEQFSNLVQDVFPENKTLLCGGSLDDEGSGGSATHISAYSVILILISGLLAREIM